MKTFFAPAERATDEQVHEQVGFVTNNPIVTTLLHSAGGLLAILNEQRQVLAVNEAVLAALGIKNPSELLGLRPGEALGCVHAKDMEGGCGTSRHCQTCGAVISMLASLQSDKPEERKCVMTVEHNQKPNELCFTVRSAPLHFENRRFLLLFLQDITAQINAQESERVFFHDINNILTSLLGATEMLRTCEETRRTEMISVVRAVSQRLLKEIDIHRTMLRENIDYLTHKEEFALAEIIEKMRLMFANHPAARDKQLVVTGQIPATTYFTDVTLLTRVLANMITNAFEATPSGGQIRLGIETFPKSVVFHVWNAGHIPDDIAQRIFQRHFSTKEGEGRGLGTYGMKLLGEQMLGGQVTFESSPETGVEFRFVLPL